MKTGINEKIIAIIKKEDKCVLATSSGNRPLCSLMAYASNFTCDEIYLMTLNNSRKYQNMCENPEVSILIDTRHGFPESNQNEIMALTLSGKFERIIDETEKESILKELSSKHSDLKEFLENPEAEPVKITVTSYLLMEGPTKSNFLDVSDFKS